MSPWRRKVYAGSRPPLKMLHKPERLVPSKLLFFSTWSTDDLVESVRPGKEGALKTRPSGVMLDGHHRVQVLRDRGYDTEKLPREILERRDDV